jgi:O-antigen/teichoic acid export membrane protein
MSWKYVVCLLLVILGIILFLYGANAYDPISGYSGIGLFILGLVLYAVLQGYEAMLKNKKKLEPVKA